MGIVNGLLFVLAICTVLLGLFLSIGVIALFFDAESTYQPLELAAMWIFLGLLPITAGGFLARFALRRNKNHKSEAHEREILNLAARKGGKLTPAEVATHTQLDSKQAQQILETLHERSMVEMKVTDGGVIVYNFPGLLSNDQKHKAQGYMDN